MVLQPTSDAQKATAVLRGRVTDKESGAPIARAVVRLYNRDSQRQQVTPTDDDGRYELGGLPAGRYSGFVEPGDTVRRTSAAELYADRRGRDRAEARRDAHRRKRRPRTIARDDGPRRRRLGRAVGRRQDFGEVRGYRRDPAIIVSAARPTIADGSGSLSFHLGDILPVLKRPCLLSPPTLPTRRGANGFYRTCYPDAAAEEKAQPVRIDGADPDEIVIQMRLGRTFAFPERSSTPPAPRRRLPSRPWRRSSRPVLHRHHRRGRGRELFGRQTSHRATTRSRRPSAVPRGPSTGSNQKTDSSRSSSIPPTSKALSSR